MDQFKKYLSNNKYNKNIDSSPTHTIIPNENSVIPEIQYGYSLKINDDEINEFNNCMSNLFFEHGINIPLTESFGEKSPLILDLDIIYENVNAKQRFYTEKTVENLVKLIWNNITVYFSNFDNNDKWDECWITEKKEPTYIEKDDELKVKDGLHIIYPNIIGDTKVFKEFIRRFSENENNILKVVDIFRETSINNMIPSNDVSKIFDSNVQRWFVYGCGKKFPYLLTNVYDCITMNQKDVTLYSNDEIIKKICLLKKFEQNIEYKNEIDNILKVKLSNSSSVSTFDMVDDYSSSDEDNDYDPYIDFNSDEESVNIKNTLVQKEKENIEKIVLRCFSDDRVNEYELWIKVGMCLKNTGGDQLFYIWDKFSKKGSNYNGSENCRKFWNGFKPCEKPLTRRSLDFWGRMDNEEEYMKIIEESIEKQIDECVFKGGQHDDIARVIALYFKGLYKCVDLKDAWFYFNGTKWVPCLKGYRLHKELSGQIKEIFYNRHKFYKKEMDKAEANEDIITKENYDGYQKAAYKIYENLKNVSFCENIMKACKLKFYEEKVMEKMDSNTNLIGFDNCVYDLQENILREGRPEDYISMTTKLDMPIHKNELPLTPEELLEKIQDRVGKYSNTKDKIWDFNKWDNGDKKYYNRVSKDIDKFFKQILPDKDIRKYCLRFIATRLCGDVLEQRFSIWTGSGGNGKSILIDLIRATFGEYCINLPVTLLTQKRKASNAASPEKARTLGVRFCYMQEPDSNERINAGEMKELSGGDMIQARKLYSDVFEFKPQFEIVLMCNEKPSIDDKTNGAWRRVQVYPFVSRFVDDKSIINKSNHVYPRDKKLTKKLEQWPIIFMCKLLIEWQSMGGSMDEDSIPDKIRMETENYKNQNDIIGQWISEDLLQFSVSDDDEDLTTFQELYGSFETWYQENYSNGKIDKNDIKKRLIDWQKKSKWGFADGINGNTRYPKFNLKPKEE